MSESSVSNIPNLVVMIRPSNFGFNAQTAASNAFQNNETIDNIQVIAQNEFDAMVEKMRAKKIRVQLFHDLRNDLPDSVFSNNWMAQLPEKTVCVFPMYTENRRAEVREDILDFISDTTSSFNRIDLRQNIELKKFLEGTGSVVFDYRNKIAYACESPRTDIALFEDFCTKIGYRPFSFQSVDLNNDLIYHTNVMLTVADKFALICLDSIHNSVERKMMEHSLSVSGHDIIPISYQQMNQFAGNCIEVLNDDQKSFLLMSESAHRSLSELQLQQINKYAEVLPFSIPTIEKIGGGSVRCMITGIFK